MCARLSQQMLVTLHVACSKRPPCSAVVNLTPAILDAVLRMLAYARPTCKPIRTDCGRVVSGRVSWEVTKEGLM
jgi:hypothetical protein